MAAADQSPSSQRTCASIVPAIVPIAVLAIAPGIVPIAALAIIPFTGCAIVPAIGRAVVPAMGRAIVLAIASATVPERTPRRLTSAVYFRPSATWPRRVPLFSAPRMFRYRDRFPGRGGFDCEFGVGTGLDPV